MTYLTKMKNLQINRRLSLNFRDSALYKIFCDNIEFTKALTAKLSQEAMQMQKVTQVTLDSLFTCIETYDKCLTFDFVAVLLNETLEEPISTNLPPAWAEKVEAPATITELFKTVQVCL